MSFIILIIIEQHIQRTRQNLFSFFGSWNRSCVCFPSWTFKVRFGMWTWCATTVSSQHRKNRESCSELESKVSQQNSGSSAGVLIILKRSVEYSRKIRPQTHGNSRWIPGYKTLMGFFVIPRKTEEWNYRIIHWINWEEIRCRPVRRCYTR